MDHLKDFLIPMPSLPIKADYHQLIEIFEKYKSQKIYKPAYKDSTLGIHNYNVMNHAYVDFRCEEFFHLFENMFPFKCFLYQFAIMPPYYDMPIHTDKGKTKSRLGFLLKGDKPVDFYKTENRDSYVGSFDYKIPALVATKKFHSFQKSRVERLVFFINFKEDYKTACENLLNFYRK